MAAEPPHFLPGGDVPEADGVVLPAFGSQGPAIRRQGDIGDEAIAWQQAHFFTAGGFPDVDRMPGILRAIITIPTFRRDQELAITRETNRPCLSVRGACGIDQSGLYGDKILVPGSTPQPDSHVIGIA